MIVEGFNAVTEALKSEMTVEKLYVQKGLFGERISRIISEARKKGVRVVFEDVSRLDKLSESKRHQGAIAVATEFKYSLLEDLIYSNKENKLLLLLDGVEDPANLGAVIRVAECAGADGIIIPKHRGVSVNDTALKTSAGAAAHLPVAKVTNINDAVRALKDAGITVYAADTDGKSLYSADLTGDVAIIIGGEGAGVHSLTKKLADGVVAIPQFGKVNSLNASVAAGIVVYEAVRQRIIND